MMAKKSAMAAELYHGLPAIGSTDLKNILKSPAHYLEAKSKWQEPTAAMFLGTLIHSVVLEPQSVDELYVIAPKFDKRTTAGKAAFAEFSDVNQGKILVSQEHMDFALSCREALQKHPAAAFLLDTAEAEAVIEWQDEKTGVACKARIDAIGPLWLADLKTTADASFDAFQRSVHKYRMHVQAAHYLAGARALGLKDFTFNIVAVETSPPYAVAVYQLDGATVEKGEELRRIALNKFATAQFTGKWTGYSEDVQLMNLPPWGFSEDV